MTLLAGTAGALTPAVARAATAVVAGVVGLVIGSFLNVVVYRVPRHLSVVTPGSFCPSCGTPVRPLDNVPVVSWLALGGRCRSCKAPISPRYPLVEGLTGALFALVAALLGPHLTVPALCTLAATYVAVVAIDLDAEPVPYAVPSVGAGLALALFLLPAAVHGTWASFAAATAAGAVVAVAVALGRRLAGSDSTGAPETGALGTLIPLGVLLGWLGPGAPWASAAGAAGTAVGALALGAARGERGRPAWARVMRASPLASALGAAIGFGVAAGLGALGGA